MERKLYALDDFDELYKKQLSYGFSKEEAEKRAFTIINLDTMISYESQLNELSKTIKDELSKIIKDELSKTIKGIKIAESIENLKKSIENLNKNIDKLTSKVD